MDTKGTIAALGLVLAGSGAHAHDLTAPWESRSEDLTDTLYTTYYNDHAIAGAANGFVDHGVVAWLRCSSNALDGPFGEVAYKGAPSAPDVPDGDSVVPSRYGHGYNVPMDFACEPPADALPLYRLYKSKPETDHVYTTSTAEVAELEDHGYAFDRVEGYLFTSQVEGSMPLYRLRKGKHATGHDVEHRYTLSSSARATLISRNWVNEGIAGYAFASYVNPTVDAVGFTGTYNGANISMTTPVTVPIRNVVPPASRLALGGSPSGSRMYGMLASNVTERPAGATWQNLRFDIYTGTWFPPVPDASPLDHMPMYLHYASQAATNQLSAVPPYDGVAITFVPGNSLNGTPCDATPDTGGQIVFEIGEGTISCGPVLATPLRSRAWYSVDYALDDAAHVRLTVTERATGRPLTFADGTTTYTASLAGITRARSSRGSAASPKTRRSARTRTARTAFHPRTRATSSSPTCVRPTRRRGSTTSRCAGSMRTSRRSDAVVPRHIDEAGCVEPRREPATQRG